MKIKILASILLGISFLSEISLGKTSNKLSLENKIKIAKTRCTPKLSNEPHFFMDMFKSNALVPEIDALYKTVYNQTERLFNRAGYHPKTQSFISQNDKISVIFPEHFLKSVILHIESALRLNYVKYIFFPDMGHSHLQIPREYYNKHYSNINTLPPSPLNYLLNTPHLKSLYHTAENLKLRNDSGKLLKDPYIQWRFYTRNLLVDNKGNIELLTNFSSTHNTVSSVKNHRWFYGISISANKNGCFPFKDSSGEIQYFDISAWDPPSKCANSHCMPL